MNVACGKVTIVLVIVIRYIVDCRFPVSGRCHLARHLACHHHYQIMLLQDGLSASTTTCRILLPVAGALSRDGPVTASPAWSLRFVFSHYLLFSSWFPRLAIIKFLIFVFLFLIGSFTVPSVPPLQLLSRGHSLDINHYLIYAFLVTHGCLYHETATPLPYELCDTIGMPYCLRLFPVLLFFCPHPCTAAVPLGLQRLIDSNPTMIVTGLPILGVTEHEVATAPYDPSRSD